MNLITDKSSTFLRFETIVALQLLSDLTSFLMGALGKKTEIPKSNVISNSGHLTSGEIDRHENDYATASGCHKRYLTGGLCNQVSGHNLSEEIIT